MTTVSYPGVYIEEISSGNRPIAMSSPSTPAFVGMADKGPDDEAVRITSWDEFITTFGSFSADGYLAESVFQYFDNGGKQCYVVRLTRSDAATADVTLNNRAGAPVAGIKFSAANKGAWANSLLLSIEDGTDDPGNTIKVIIREQKTADVVPAALDDLTILEEHDNLSMDSSSTDYLPTIIDRDSNVLAAEVLAANISVQNGFHKGDVGPSLTTPTDRKFQISLDNDGYHEVAIDAGVDGTDPAAIAAAIEIVVGAVTPNKAGNAAAFSSFTCTVGTDGTNSWLILTSGTSSAASSVKIQNSSADNGAIALKIGAANGGVSESGITVRRPALSQKIQLGDAPVVAPVTDATIGADGSAGVNESSYSAKFTLLDKITDVSMLAVPGIGTSVMYDEGVKYCENRPLRDIFYIGEMEEYRDTLSEAEQFRKQITKPNSYGAVYFPWIKALDLSGLVSKPVNYPPSGFIAGLCARIDTTRGVWKAPAGTEATISGAVDITYNLTDTQQGNLNKVGINCIRRFDTAGIVSWGSRTVTSDPEYLYVPVRRTAIMLKRSIYDGIQWAVFEPNNHGLWSALRMNIGSFMNGLFRAGAFQGEKASQAYFVRCGLGDTMTQGDIDRGMVIVQVGFAPLKPAEFVIVRIQQKVGQQ